MVEDLSESIEVVITKLCEANVTTQSSNGVAFQSSYRYILIPAFPNNHNNNNMIMISPCARTDRAV